MSEYKDYKLPEGWKFSTIPELIGKSGFFSDGDWVESKDQDPDGDVRLIQLADIGDGVYRNKSSRFLTSKNAKKMRCKFLIEGDILIARMPDPLGRACIFPGDIKKSITAVDVCIIRSSNNEFNHRWLMWFINTPKVRSLINNLQSGSTRKRISRKNLGTIALPVPPIQEQQVIVAEIEKQFTRLDAGVAALKRLQINLKRYRAAVLKAACEGKLVPTEAELARREGREFETASVLLERILKERREKWMEKNPKKKYVEPKGPDMSNLAELPEGWCWATVDQIGQVQLGKMLDKTKHTKGKKLTYLRNINVRWGRIGTDDLLEMFFKISELERFNLKKGDVLVCEGGEPGRSAVWDGRNALMKYQKALHRVRFWGNYEPQLIIYLLEFLAKTGRLEKLFTGSTVKHFTRESFIKLAVPLPPLREQYRIISEVERRLSVNEEMELAVDANIMRSERLRQAVLQRAFEGKILSKNHF